ncbi:hypothetical protein ASPWEDRAFT_29249 [Aspergillus wentii DTO 134E9]|uniref:Uncharacterized protein n=1 Tax=Aspergillus wentii DTO 134E9 TaxID=1073089 RepID=A0A1L9RGM2_ASPWE|nr:uncharacterized protein ASPWEDRAFT_29249 [Aspergillus wentii DTO 134E9]KAI9927857.1 hypothetical protein MW887_002709 [Aspergillus wentii]OJJ34075.1 hypothetical protein ASPWEDRAFT_29249 [Aspergillus wentii DTO 134E9]
MNRLYWLFLAGFAQQCLSLTLREIAPPQDTPHLLTRSDGGWDNNWPGDLSDPDHYNHPACNTTLAPRQVESFYWGGVTDQGRAAIANFTVTGNGHSGHLLSMEKFRNLLSSVQCTNNTMTVGFKDQQIYDWSKEAWGTNHTFTVVAGAGDCGWNENRLPFVVSRVQFGANKMARLIGRPSNWEAVASDYELSVGGPPPAGQGRSLLNRRNWSPSFSLDFDRDLPLDSYTIPNDKIDITIDCDDCGTKGSFDFDFHIKTKFGAIPESATMSITPDDVSFSITPRLSVSGTLKGEMKNEKVLARIPVEGISIPGGILNLGPQIVFSLGYKLNDIDGEGTVSAGVALDLKDSASIDVDFFDPNITATGWKPKVSPIPVAIDSEIDGEFEIYAKAALQLSAEVVKKGYEVNVNVEPFVGANLNALQSLSGACPDDEDKKQFGVEIDPDFGATINAELAKAKKAADPIVSTQLAETTVSTGSTCVPFGAAATSSRVAGGGGGGGGHHASSSYHRPSSIRASATATPTGSADAGHVTPTASTGTTATGTAHKTSTATDDSSSAEETGTHTTTAESSKKTKSH